MTKKYCLEVNSFNFCIRCENGFYPDVFGFCKEVTNIIAGCEEYIDE